MQTFLAHIEFPQRDLFKKVEVVAVYIEPRVDSGERICVGVVAFQSGAVKFARAPNLARLRCLYGAAHTGLVYAGELALKSLADTVLINGFHQGLEMWKPPAQGIFVGTALTTSSSSLDDAIRVSLTQFSSLYAEPDADENDEPSENDVRQSSAGNWRLERLVKETTLLLRPGFESRFGQKHRIKEGARPMRLGYVGQRLVANFGMLTPRTLASTVNTSKAKLWDLAQAREGTHGGWFDAGAINSVFELFVHKPADGEYGYTLKQKADVAEAVEELEVEADKLRVRCVSVTSPVEIAQLLVSADS